MCLYCIERLFIKVKRGKNRNRAGNISTYLTLFFLIHKIFSFASLLDRFTTGMKSVHLNEIVSFSHFLLESKNIWVPTGTLSHTHTAWGDNIVFWIWLKDMLTYVIFFFLSTLNRNLCFTLPHSSKILRPNQMLFYNPHYFLENLWGESCNDAYLVQMQKLKYWKWLNAFQFW